MLAGDFNAQEGDLISEIIRKDYKERLYKHELHSKNNNPTCYKNPNNLSNIDLILTNCLKKFFKTDTIFISLFDFHKLVLSVFKTTFTKSKPKK